MRRSLSRNRETAQTIRASLGICILTVALTTRCALIGASTLDLTPADAGTIVDVAALPHGTPRGCHRRHGLPPVDRPVARCSRAGRGDSDRHRARRFRHAD